MGDMVPLHADHPGTILLQTLFEPGDIVDVRALHKDQKWIPDASARGGHHEPRPHIYHVEARAVPRLFSQLESANADGRNIYFGANPRQGKSMTDVACFRAVFVDLDHVSEEEAMEELGLVRAQTRLPHPSVVVSSGRGVHLYWRISHLPTREEWSAVQRRLIKAFSAHADPAIHDAPRVMRLPGFTNHKNGATARLLHADALAIYGESAFDGLPVIQAPAPSGRSGTGSAEGAFERAQAYFSMRDPAGEGQRNNECYKIAAACFCDYELSGQETLDIVLEWNQKNHPPLAEAEITRVLARAERGARGDRGSKNRPPPDGPSPLQDPSPPPDGQDPPPPPPPAEHEPPPVAPPSWSAATPPADAPRSPMGAGRVDLNLLADLIRDCHLIAGTTTVWHAGMMMRMPYEALAALHPEESKAWRSDRGKKVLRPEQLVFSPSGVVAPGCVNTFQGFATQPDERDCPLLREHLAFLCGGDPQVIEWVTCWLAHQVQRPGEKVHTALVLHGGQGTGKSMFFEAFSAIFAPYSLTINQAVMESEFTGWIENRCFIVAEEVLAVKQRSRLKNLIKQMVTGGKVPVNHKYGHVSYEMPCLMNLVFLSNELMPLVIENDDRRFMVIRRDGPKDADYYLALGQEIADNGPGRLLSYLLKIDLGEWHAHTKPLWTAAKDELIAVGRPSHEEFLEAWVAGDIADLQPNPATGQDLFLAYAAWCRLTGAFRYDKNMLLAAAKLESRITYRKTESQRWYLPASAISENKEAFRESMEELVKKANRLTG